MQKTLLIALLTAALLQAPTLALGQTYQHSRSNLYFFDEVPDDPDLCLEAVRKGVQLSMDTFGDDAGVRRDSSYIYKTYVELQLFFPSDQAREEYRFQPVANCTMTELRASTF